jgi:hypothetical protein
VPAQQQRQRSTAAACPAAAPPGPPHCKPRRQPRPPHSPPPHTHSPQPTLHCVRRRLVLLHSDDLGGIGLELAAAVLPRRSACLRVAAVGASLPVAARLQGGQGQARQPSTVPPGRGRATAPSQPGLACLAGAREAPGWPRVCRRPAGPAALAAWRGWWLPVQPAGVPYRCRRPSPGSAAEWACQPLQLLPAPAAGRGGRGQRKAVGAGGRATAGRQAGTLALVPCARGTQAGSRSRGPPHLRRRRRRAQAQLRRAAPARARKEGRAGGALAGARPRQRAQPAGAACGPAGAGGAWGVGGCLRRRRRRRRRRRGRGCRRGVPAAAPPARARGRGRCWGRGRGGRLPAAAPAPAPLGLVRRSAKVPRAIARLARGHRLRRGMRAGSPAQVV